MRNGASLENFELVNYGAFLIFETVFGMNKSVIITETTFVISVNHVI